MFGLKTLQSTLNNDLIAQKEFFRDPIQALENEGVELPLALRQAVREFVKSSTTPTSTADGSSMNSANFFV